MNSQETIQIILILVTIFSLSIPLGKLMARLFEGRIKFFERRQIGLLNLLNVNPTNPMNVQSYMKNLLFFNLIGFLYVFLTLIFQKSLPLNLEQLGNVEWTLAFNTAMSFVTNTNWQSYAGESTLSYHSQMTALAVQNFVSASTGICVLLVLIRSFTNCESDKVGNFFDDMIKSTLYVFLPLAIIFSIFLVSQGVIQNFSPYLKLTTLEGVKQVIPMGPVASQEAIKMLGTNGGGFFNANSAHPFENPTALSNFIQLISILLIPASLIIMFGEMLKKPKEALMIYGVMGFLLILGVSIAIWAETQPNPALNVAINFEGKEFRFANATSALWTVFTTAASNGSINSLISSLNPMTALVALFNMMLGEIIFGGVGSGLYGFILFILLAVFVAGLMVGRTPEYLGKKIEAFEMKMVIVALLIPNLSIIFGSLLSLNSPNVLSSLSHKGVHGFSEIIYAVTSASANNGSAFAGISANTKILNILLGILMFLGRFGVIIPVFKIAESLSKKKIIPQSSGTLATDNFTFGLLTVFVILIVGGLTFFPCLVLGPVLEQMLMYLKIII